jgi:hypothetical protein
MPDYGETEVKVIKEVKLPSPDAAPGEKARLKIERTDADVIELKAIDPNGQEIFTWVHKNRIKAGNLGKKTLCENTQKYTYTETGDQLAVTNGKREYTFCKQTGRLMQVMVNGKKVDYEVTLDSLITIPLERGENVIEMTFSPNYFKLAVVLSIIGVLMLLGVFLYEYKDGELLDKIINRGEYVPGNDKK